MPTWLIPLAFAWYTTYISQPKVGEATALAGEPKVLNIYEDGLDVHIVDTAQANIALIAMDRQCGSCHQGSHSTNQAALAIFNLANECWYCTLRPEHMEGLSNRIKGSKFTAEEQAAITSLVGQLSEKNF